MRVCLAIAAVSVLAGLARPCPAQPLTTVTIGVVPSVPAGATYIAIEKGYFRDGGIDVALENVESAAAAIAMLATDRVQVVEGGIAAGYWNALARRFFLALVRGGRDYCQAYHHGPNRQEVEDILWKYHASDDRALIHTMAWQARDPNGRFTIASVLDLQDWFPKEGMIDEKFPAGRLIDPRFADYAAQQLPPFEVVDKYSKLGGCR